jgi:hypothetical protein
VSNNGPAVSEQRSRDLHAYALGCTRNDGSSMRHEANSCLEQRREAIQ